MILIAGLGGNCKDSLTDMMRHFQNSEVLFYTDFIEDKSISFFESRGLKVLVGQENLMGHFFNQSKDFISFIGDNYKREQQVIALTKSGGIVKNYVSPTAMVNNAFCAISDSNAIIMHFANVSAGSTIEEGAIIYAYTAIAHDVRIGRYAFVSAHCAISNSEIGDYTFVGLNSMIGPGVKVGKHCIIGANSYVKSDLPDGVIAVGSPAKIIGENKNVPK